MRTANIPPPMALHQLSLEECVVDTAINSSTSQVAILTHSNLSIYSYGASSKQFSAPILISKHPIPTDCGNPCQLSLCDSDTLVILTHHRNVNEDRLYVWSDGSSKWVLFETGMEHISTISTSSDLKTLCIQVQTGLVLQASREFGTLQLRGQMKLPMFCPWTEVVTVGDQVNFLK